MKWLNAAWQLVRDIALTGLGMWLIISQIGAREPSATLLVVGLTLTAPAAATHAYTVLSGPSEPGRGRGESSPSAPPPVSPPSSPPPEVTREHA